MAVGCAFRRFGGGRSRDRSGCLALPREELDLIAAGIVSMDDPGGLLRTLSNRVNLEDVVVFYRDSDCLRLRVPSDWTGVEALDVPDVPHPPHDDSIVEIIGTLAPAQPISTGINSTILHITAQRENRRHSVVLNNTQVASHSFSRSTWVLAMRRFVSRTVAIPLRCRVTT